MNSNFAQDHSIFVWRIVRDSLRGDKGFIQFWGQVLGSLLGGEKKSKNRERGILMVGALVRRT